MEGYDANGAPVEGEATVMKRYAVFIASLTELPMQDAFPLNYTRVVLASDHDAYIQRLSEQLAAAKRECERLRNTRQWQPIETAPKDTVVLLYTPHRHFANPERIEACVYHDSQGGSRHAWATHWQPLPDPPARREG